MSFEGITETPGIGAGSEQLSILRTRYHLAREHAAGKRVLEVACGAGMGLPYLAAVAESVTGIDIEAANVTRSSRWARELDNVSVAAGDALDLQYEDDSFDEVILFEALYYLSDPNQFLSEVRRVLSPGGKLIISSVNCEWHGFNPSPFSRTYFGARDLEQRVRDAGFEVEMSCGFLDAVDHSSKAKVLSIVKRVAVKLHLIPKTMRGKTLLKRIVFGKLTLMPDALTDEVGELETRVALPGHPVGDHKFLYCVATA